MNGSYLKRHDQVSVDESTQRILSVRFSRKCQGIARLVTAAAGGRVFARGHGHIVDAFWIVLRAVTRITRCIPFRFANVRWWARIPGAFVDDQFAFVATISVFTVTRRLVTVAWSNETGDISCHRHCQRVIQHDPIVTFSVNAQIRRAYSLETPQKNESIKFYERSIFLLIFIIRINSNKMKLSLRLHRVNRNVQND